MSGTDFAHLSNVRRAERFGDGIVAYGAWRTALSGAIGRYVHWLDDEGLADASNRARLDALVERLATQSVTVAFVAEFSRGKSELINAIFFSGYGQRVVPTSAGRTTMCPTELLYDRERRPSIRLLPIETRARPEPLSELRRRDAEWVELPIDPADRRSVVSALEFVRETREVSVREAVALGLHDENDEASGDALVDIPRWRHAIVNVPDPLLEAGLVVIDTPGLNAIGDEPELSLSMIPGADAVLFVVAADAGVTRSDVDVWRRHIDPNHGAGRFVVMNKIDGLWDELREESQIELEIAQQVASVARTLDVVPERIFPVSAQKGLVARVRGDRALLHRSRLPDLEEALSRELIDRRQTFVRERAIREFGGVAVLIDALLDSRCAGVDEQLADLSALRGRNRDVTSQLAASIRLERSVFERSMRRLRALRTVYSRTSQSMHARVGMRSLREHVRVARDAMGASRFSTGLRDAMGRMLADARADFDAVAAQTGEITQLMQAMHAAFDVESVGEQVSVPAFSLQHYFDELQRVEEAYRTRFGAFAVLTTEKSVLIRRFFESVGARLRELYEAVSRELDAWLRALIAPVEARVRERHDRLRRRLDSVRRVLDATENLDDRIAELGRERVDAEKRRARAHQLATSVREILDLPLPESA